jgi:hypothetical protein
MGDMDKKTILIKTSKGESEVSGMSGDMKRVLLLIDGDSTYAEIVKHAPPSLRGDLPDIIQSLIDSELIRDKSKVQAGPKIVAPKVVAPKFVTPKADQGGEELDFTSMFVAPDAAALAAEATNTKAAQEAEKLKASREAEKQKAEAEARARAEAEVRARSEQEAARVKAELEAAAKAKAEAEAAKLKAEQEAARIKAELEAAKAKAEAEAKALAEERARHEAEAARIKAEAEAARVRAEQEAARIKAEKEAARIKAEQEAERVRAEQEAARIKAEQEAAARAKAEAEARAREEAEAARLKAELEAAKAKAEAEAKALAEERARQEAEAARLKAEQEEAARIKAEQEVAERAEAARLQAEAEAARIKQEQEAAERAKAEAEARIKAEQEAARIKAEQEAAARVKAEAEAARIKAEQEAARIAAEREAADRAKAEAAAARKKSEVEAAQSAQVETKKEVESTGFQIDLAALSAMDSSTDADELARPTSSASEKAAPAPEKTVKQVEPEAKQDIAAEMARLKAEQEAERLRAEQEARALEEEQALAAEQESAWAEAEQRAEQQSKLDAAQAAKEAALAQAKSKQKSTTIRRRNPLPLGKIAAGLMVLGVIAIFVLPMFWPMQEYIGPLEQRLTERFKQPVKVGGMSASLLPMPKIELVDVKVGAAGEFTAAAATLNFDLLSLLSDSKTINDVALQGATLSGKDLDKVAGWLKGMGSDTQFPLQHVTLHNLKIVSDEISVPPLQGGADFDQGEFSRLVLHSDDEKFNVELKAVANRTQLTFGIREGALPLLPSAMFSSFNARGEINAGEINISDLDAHAYGGIWSGNGKLNWSKGWKFDANIKAKTMELAELFPKYGLSGEVFIDGEVSASAATLSNLAKTLRVDASFEAKRGVISGIDMVDTARLASREHLVGGRTNFDELNGSFVAESGHVRFRSVRITSGMLKASGTLDAAVDGQLSGAFNSELKIRSGNNPLSLSGTLSEPKLKAR